MEAVIIILKHATSLCLLNFLSAKSALTYVDLAYQEANIDFKIQQLLMASSQEHSVQLFSGFIMATDIGLFILASVT